ncbi:hypothetical protein T11_14117 [Trichinella zimbabwensis]|uniref:Uncharacterized protein n=1 Tax=Trichinella zimbabwensis TaxID=268475 RepID=A0A0V1GTF3_9BILA|nr:hypothetical protein T11_14117 [Trichinella zimbabwensis]
MRMLLHPCLLGIDFLWPRKASINLGQECDIGLLETVTLPAQTEMMIAGRSDRSLTSDDRFLKPKMVTNYSVMATCSLSRAAGGTVPNLSQYTKRDGQPLPKIDETLKRSAGQTGFQPWTWKVDIGKSKQRKRMKTMMKMKKRQPSLSHLGFVNSV